MTSQELLTVDNKGNRLDLLGVALMALLQHKIALVMSCDDFTRHHFQ